MLFLLLFFFQGEDLESRLQRRPTVSFDLKETPLRAAFQQISGLEFEVDGRIANDPVTVRIDKLGPFEAAHAVCRAHGRSRLLFATFSRRIQIVPGETASMPQSDSGPFHYLLSNLLLTRSTSFDDKRERGMTLTLWLAWTEPGAPASISTRIVVVEAVDDTGRDLKPAAESNAAHTRLLGKPVLADVATLRLPYPADGAKKIRRLKGYREGVFIAETRDLRIQGLDSLPAASNGQELTVTKYGRGAKGISAVLEGPRPEGSFTLPDHHLGLCFVDERGRRFPVRVTGTAVGAERVSFEVLVHDVPKDAVIVACESRMVVRWQSYRIPFDFADVELP